MHFLAKNEEEKSRVQFPVFEGKPIVCLSDEDVKRAEKYVFEATSREVTKFNDVTKLQHVIKRDNVLLYSGRILDGMGPSNPLQMVNDLPPAKFLCPVIDRYSPVAYAIVTHAHVTLCHHAGIITTLRAAENIAHILQGKHLAAEIVRECNFCKRYKAKREKAVMGGVPLERMTVAPAFYHVQIDLFGPLESHCKHGRRAVVKVYGVIYKCMTSLAVSVNVMDSYSTASFLDSFYRFTSRYGVPAKVFIDSGTQLLAAFREGDFSTTDVTRTLNGESGVAINYDVCPVNSHEANGLVERAIREVKKIFVTVFDGLKMDILRLETVFAWICNELNSLPICLGNNYRDLDHTDLITPNRLILGRNNQRAVGGLSATCQPQNVVKQLEDVEKAWWTVWLRERLNELVPRPAKWASGDPDVKVGDVIVFIRDKTDIGGLTWRIGMIEEMETGADGVCRRVMVKYRVVRADGTVERDFRRTRRSVRDVAVVARENELDLVGKLNQAQKAANIQLCMAGCGQAAG